MAEKRDYYEVLGVSKTATDKEIKSAYLKLAKQYHPDLNKDEDAPAKFKEVTEAYEVLKDKDKRARYDQYGFAGVDPNAAAGAGGFNGFNGGFDGQDVDLGDIFSQFFGGGARQSSRRTTGPIKGEDSLIKIKISFEDAVEGTTVEIPISYDETCKSCSGTGAKNGTSYTTCSYCNGTGVIRTQQRTIFGTVSQQGACPHCNGTGKKIKDSCPDCNGQGYKHVSSKIDVTIPAGIDNGQQIRVQGKGKHGYNGGPSGDLYIQVVVASDSRFKRDGKDIHVTIPIPVVNLILGCTITVDTVYGKCDVEVNPGTPVDAILKLKGKGIKATRSYENNGDEYIHLDVKVPSKITSEQKEILAKFNQIEEEKPGNKSVFERIKSKFKK